MVPLSVGTLLHQCWSQPVILMAQVASSCTLTVGIVSQLLADSFSVVTPPNSSHSKEDKLFLEVLGNAVLIMSVKWLLFIPFNNFTTLLENVGSWLEAKSSGRKACGRTSEVNALAEKTAMDYFLQPPLWSSILQLSIGGMNGSDWILQE